jgi:AhpD family alkylhydroperoxidase
MSIDDWERERERLNNAVLGTANLGVKRFFALDHQAYLEGALDVRTKEMLGLVASLVLRCDDCITYHVLRCHQEGVTCDEMVEAMNVGLIVGGSIVISHLRRAVDRLIEAERRSNERSSSPPAPAEHVH